MKTKLIFRFACIAILIIFQLSAKSQMFLVMDGGASFGPAMEVKDEYLLRRCLRVGLSIGYSFKHNEKARAVVAASMHIPVTNILSNAPFGLSAGPVIHLISKDDEEQDLMLVPTVGYYYCFVTNDKKFLNTFAYGYGLRLQKYRCYVSANNVRNTWQLAFGLIGFM